MFCIHGKRRRSLRIAAAAALEAFPSILNTDQMAGKLTLFKSGNSGSFPLPLPPSTPHPNPFLFLLLLHHHHRSLRLRLSIFPFEDPHSAVPAGNRLKLEGTRESDTVMKQSG